MLEGYDLPAYPHNSAAVLHRIAEALKAAFADRHGYYGDPEFTKVPIRGLLSKEYAADWRRRIDLTRAAPGMPIPGIRGRMRRAGADPSPRAGSPPRQGPSPPTRVICA
jgi:gamma-glutamyltranspeptidase / glutathione hydrolase